VRVGSGRKVMPTADGMAKGLDLAKHCLGRDDNALRGRGWAALYHWGILTVVKAPSIADCPSRTRGVIRSLCMRLGSFLLGRYAGWPLSAQQGPGPGT
jgi:hypothetical protein